MSKRFSKDAGAEGPITVLEEVGSQAQYVCQIKEGTEKHRL